MALQSSVLNFAAPAWQPFLSPSELERLQKAQNKSLRIINGQYNSTPVEALRAEANMPNYATASKRLIATSYERALYLPIDHPRYITALKEVDHRLWRSSWRKEAKALVQATPLDTAVREPLPCPFTKPWEEAEYNNLVHDTELHTTVEAISEKVTAFGPKVTIYTDGSCQEGVKDGGAAAVIAVGPIAGPKSLHVLKE